MLSKRIITAILLLLITALSAQKLQLQKTDIASRTKQSVHPLEKHFNKPSSQRIQPLKRTENRLLVMMVDFQEDDDPQTTGNGKFVFSDPDYILDLGKPPHDQEYNWWVLESVRYYYQAASLGAFNLDFDIYPQYEYSDEDTAIVAYTLPQQMAYYNPPGADTELMISRFEEYFTDVFETVDADSTVDFSQYAHFMILHAGSDSQHNIAGDTPADIPSFFIQIGDGKEVIVDDGIVIDHACNVPETISQDGQYGVTNAVIAHEFGHSLGYIDLYSTLTGAPQAGWFDIMDSGGMGELIVMEIDGEYITIEGGVPTLPSAWHRILAWEDYFRANKMLVDISELDWSESIRIDPASKLYEGGRVAFPYFVKVPLNEKEYLLIENRQVDPDGDGGLSFKGALPQNPNGSDKRYRILLYPTYPFDDPRDTPNWEYDFFLPGWQRQIDAQHTYNYGGGLLIWHIDERIIYEEGEWEDGEFYSNYDMNTVNALHTHRGIKVYEADGYDNIGNYSDSYNILGSAWDYFYRYQPLLDGDGEFLRYDDLNAGYDSLGTQHDEFLVNESEFIHTIEFNGNSQPALVTNDGDPAFLGLWNISSCHVDFGLERYMTFNYGSHLYNNVKLIEEFESLQDFSIPVQMLGFPALASAGDGKLEILSNVGDEWGNHFALSYDWTEELTQPIFSYDFDADGSEEFCFVSGDKLAIINELEFSERQFSAEFTDSPLFIENLYAVYPLTDKLIINNEEISLTGGKIAWNGSYLIMQSSDELVFINPETKTVERSFDIPYSSLSYYPQVFLDEDNGHTFCYTISENGDVRKTDDTGSEVIFYSSDYTEAAPTQIQLTLFNDYEAARLVFAAGDRLFALNLNGSLLPGFPLLMENKPSAAGSFLKSFLFNEEVILMVKRETQGWLAVDTSGNLRPEYSTVFPQKDDIEQKYWFDEENSVLHWFGANQSDNIFSGFSYIDSDPIINCGFRNEKYGLYRGMGSSESNQQTDFTAYAYPNPAREGHARFRVSGAEEEISLKLYDIAGNLVKTEIVSCQENELHDIRIETSGLESGIYYARISSGSKKLTTALGIIK